MRQWFQRKFVQFLVQRLFNTITEDDLLKTIGRDTYFQGKVLSPEIFVKVKQDAIVFRESLLWKVVSNDAKFRANKQIFESSNNTQDILFGKALLYLLDVIEKKLDTLAR